MMGLSAINYANKQAAKKSRGKLPKQFFSEEGVMTAERIPNFGDYRPKDWVLLDEPKPFFVDASGYGSEGEPALTMGQFRRALTQLVKEHPEYGYAVISSGQFQVHVGVFAPKKDEPTGRRALGHRS